MYGGRFRSHRSGSASQIHRVHLNIAQVLVGSHINDGYPVFDIHYRTDLSHHVNLPFNNLVDGNGPLIILISLQDERNRSGKVHSGIFRIAGLFKPFRREFFNISLDDVYYLEQSYEVSGFLRTYMPVGRSKIFGLFNECRLTYGYARGKNSTGSGTSYDGTFETAHSLEIGFAPGVSAFVTDWAAVEVSMGVMGFNFKWVDQKTNQVEHGKRRTSSGDFKINLFSINIGMTFYL